MTQAKDRRDERLWALLPAKDALYDCNQLSQAETAALGEALSDGFGDRANGYVPMTLPNKIKSGLLEHSFHVSPHSDYDPDELDDVFWRSEDDDGAPAPAEKFPLHFNLRRLAIYFRNQFDRFCEKEVCDRMRFWEQHRLEYELPPYEEYRASLNSDEERWTFEMTAARLLYQKPWYEVHALQFLGWIVDRDIQKHPKLAHLVNIDFSGQLGRLVEQYYWRFRFEDAAITGTGARKGASAGGKAKAALHRVEHYTWQAEASKIWARRPALSKAAVAEQIKRQLGGERTAKHIARYIHPNRGCWPLTPSGPF